MHREYRSTKEVYEEEGGGMQEACRRHAGGMQEAKVNKREKKVLEENSRAKGLEFLLGPDEAQLVVVGTFFEWTGATLQMLVTTVLGSTTR